MILINRAQTFEVLDREIILDKIKYIGLSDQAMKW